jgi:ribosome-associated protein
MTKTKTSLLPFTIEALEDLKATEITSLSVEHLTEMTNHMVITTATSKQHCRSLGKHLVVSAKKNDLEILGVEGMEDSEWVLVDLGDVIVHIMLEKTRAFYELEKLWNISKTA